MEKKKYDVFISYSRKDSNVVNRIMKAFDKAGVSYFVDRGIVGAMEFPQVLADAIMDSSIMLFVASKNSYASKFANKEITFAFNKKKNPNAILPYIIDGSELPRQMELIFSNTNIENIKDHPIETRLVEDILHLLERNNDILTLPPTKNSNMAKKISIGAIVILSLVLLAGGIYWLNSPSASRLYHQGMALYDTDDINEAFPLLLKSAEMGYDSAQYAIGEMYETGLGVGENDSEAEKWYKKAADQGHGLAQYWVASKIFNESFYGGDGSLEEAIKLFEAAASQNVAKAKLQLAKLYHKGLGVERNDKKSFDLCQQAALQGDAEAQLNLGDRYLNGVGTEQNDAQALLWYKASAEQGNADAQNEMGDYYMGKYGGVLNYEEAFLWFSKSVKQGNKDAYYKIGNIYAQKEEWAEATEYYQKAAEKGQVDALYTLGAMYWYGLYPLQKNTVEGMKLLKKAAEKDNPAAMCLIGKIYEYGLGGYNKNKSEAKEWYENAAALGDDEAASLLKQIDNNQY